MPHTVGLSRSDDGLVLSQAARIGDLAVLGPDPMLQATEKGVYVVFSETAMSGVVEITTAHSVGWSGVWHRIATIDWVGPGRCHYVSIPGIHLAIKIAVVQPIVNGTVSVYAVGS